MKELAAIDRAIDEVLVQLGQMVLSLSNPLVTTNDEERKALARSVNQYSVCASHSGDARVQRLKVELENTLKPRLRLVHSR
jgi:low affinity Fe/Cu permease